MGIANAVRKAALGIVLGIPLAWATVLVCLGASLRPR
jgi:hypothetical protein